MKHDMTNTRKTTCYYALSMNETKIALPLNLEFCIDVNTHSYIPVAALLELIFPSPRYNVDILTDEIHVYDNEQKTQPDPDSDPDADVRLCVSYQYE